MSRRLTNKLRLAGSLPRSTFSDMMGLKLFQVCVVAEVQAAQVDGSVWAALLALIWLYGYKIQQQDEWQFVAMKASSWIRSQNVGGLSQCVSNGNVLLGCQVKEETLGI